MSAGRDVDDTILDQATFLLPYVRANGVPDVTVRSLSDVPWLLVLVFELLTTESIPQEMKPFSTTADQAETLQMILNTLELTLQLPLNHITGRGLARLERRHLSDALQIFIDLVKHYFPEKEFLPTGFQDAAVSTSPEGQRLSLSQFNSPDNEFEEIHFSRSYTPPLSALPADLYLNLQAKQVEQAVARQKTKPRRESPVVTVKPIPQSRIPPIPLRAETISTKITRDNSENLKKNLALVPPPEKDASLVSSSSSTTLLKEVYRKSFIIDTSGQEKTQVARTTSDQTTNHEMEVIQTRNPELSPEVRHVFEHRLPSLSLLSPKASKQKMFSRSQSTNSRRTVSDKIASPTEARSMRFQPYKPRGKAIDLIEYPLTKRVRDNCNKEVGACSRPKDKMANTKNLKRPPSAKFVACRRPSVRSFKSPAVVSKRTPTATKANKKTTNPKPSKSTSNNKPTAVNRNCSSSQMALTKHRIGSSKEPYKPVNRARKSSVVSSKSNTPPRGTIRKPPQLLARKSVNKNAGSSFDRRSERSVGSSRQHNGDCVGRKSKTSESEAYESKIEEHVRSRRKPSVVSTKVRKHSITSPIPHGSPRSPIQPFDRNSIYRKPIKRASPQTTSLCSSLKLLKEFDFVSRRLKTIQLQKMEYIEAIKELEQEEVRLEYLLTHVQQQSTRALKHGSSERLATLGAAV